MKRVAFGVLLGLAVAGVQAEDVVKTPVAAADTPEKLQAVINDIHAQMTADGRYEFIRPDQRRDVDRDFETMQTLLRSSGSVAAMKESDRVKLFNAQEHANGILTHSDRNRLVCERRAAINSHIPTNTCQTVAEIERARAGSQKYLQDHAIDRNIQTGEYINQHGGRQ